MTLAEKKEFSEYILPFFSLIVATVLPTFLRSATRVFPRTKSVICVRSTSRRTKTKYAPNLGPRELDVWDFFVEDTILKPIIPFDHNTRTTHSHNIRSFRVISTRNKCAKPFKNKIEIFYTCKHLLL